MRVQILGVLGSAFLLTACGGGNGGDTGSADRGTGAAPEAPAAAQAGGGAAPTGGATIAGRVRLTGTAPANPTIDMSEEPACRDKYPAGQQPRAQTVVADNNGLGNVFVYVKSGLPERASYPAPSTAVVLDQDGCRYHPHVFGIMVGQPLEIRNSDPVLHNIKAQASANRPFNISQPRAGISTTRRFSRPEVMVALECNVHGWMQAYAGVRSDPFFAVSEADGSFEIAGLPAGTYTLEAWHERFGTQTATVTVTGTESATADFTFAAR